jgi:2,4-dienoyl-CoA reductase-like NADH-dependent reductase (Old Yellow Enzyme family)
MAKSTDALFRPFTVNGLTLPNRIVMAAMTRFQSPGGIPNQAVADYYARRADGGCGLIITEATPVEHPAAVDHRDVPVFHSKDSLAGWKLVCDAVHDAGGFIMPQFWHMGMARNQEAAFNPDVASVGPSGLVMPGKKTGDELSIDDIQKVIDAYVQSAVAAREIGFDGIQIHGAHGYLIDQFLWEGTNERTDEYGGDMVGRATFLLQIIEATRRAVGDDYPVTLRLSQWKQQDFDVKLAKTPEELDLFLNAFSDAGVDVIDCSTRRFWEPEFEGSPLNLAGWAKKLTGKPSITVGSVGLHGDMVEVFQEGVAKPVNELDSLIERLEREEFDLVAVGRAMLTNPDWANKVKEGRFSDLKPYDAAALASLA